MVIRNVVLSSLAITAIVSCTVQREDATSSSGAIIASAPLPIEALFPAVGKFFPIQSEVGPLPCSAVVVGPNLVLTNAHCVASLANTCNGFARNDGATGTSSGAHVRFDTNGNFSSGSFSWEIDGIATPPKAFYRDARTCALGSAGDCTNQVNAPIGYFQGARAEQDFALLHVKTSTSIPDLVARGMTPLRVVTALFDPQAAKFSHPYASHLNLNPAQFQTGGTVPWVRMVGCGTATPNDGNRHSGLAAIQQGATWPYLIPWAEARQCDGSLDASFINYAGTLLNTIPGQSSAQYAGGDSGGAILISGGQTNAPVGTPSGDYLIGLISDYVPSGSMSPTIFDSSGEARAWLEQRLLDFDGDGFTDYDGSDNCPITWNAKQSNCNYASEKAWNDRNPTASPKAGLLGDACEPVACPQFDVSATTSEYGTGAGGTALCTGDGFNTPVVCSARRVHDVADIHAVGANWLGAYSALPKQIFDHSVTVANTSARFCQSNLSAGYNCMAAQVVQDDRLQPGVLPQFEQNTQSQPYHRIVVAAGTCAIPTNIGCLSYNYGADLPRGQTLQNFHYGVAEYRSYRWNYSADSAFWGASLIPSADPAGYGATCVNPSYGVGTCLDGTLWLNSDSLIGLSSTQLPDAFVDRRDPNFSTFSDAYFANHYEPVRPDSAETWRLISAAPSTLRKFLLRHLVLPDPNPWGTWQAQHAGEGLPLFSSFGTAHAMTNQGTLNDASAMVGPALAGALDGRVWVNAAEPQSPRAVALTLDGRQLLYGADLKSGNLLLAVDLTLTARKTYSPAAWTDDARTFSTPVTIAVPAELRVSEGNAGNATLTLSYNDAAGVPRTCTFKGGASSLHPSNAAQRSLGLSYKFLSCSTGAGVGAQLVVSSLGVHIVDGDSNSGPTSAQLRVEAFEQGAAFGGSAYNGASTPPARSDYIGVYSAAADRIFIVGGLSAVGAPLTDVWQRTTGGDWASIPVALSAPLAATYSRSRMRLVVLDRTPTALEVVAVNPFDGSRTTLATWSLPSLTTRFAMMNSLEGDLLVVGGTSVVGAGHDFRVVAIDDKGMSTKTAAAPGTLVDAYADRAGYGFLVEEAAHMQRAKLLDLQPFAGAPFP
jgi:hypothetical protein